jgi:hypothetical protein
MEKIVDVRKATLQFHQLLTSPEEPFPEDISPFVLSSYSTFS